VIARAGYTNRYVTDMDLRMWRTKHNKYLVTQSTAPIAGFAGVFLLLSLSRGIFPLQEYLNKELGLFGVFLIVICFGIGLMGGCICGEEFSSSSASSQKKRRRATRIQSPGKDQNRDKAHNQLIEATWNSSLVFVVVTAPRLISIVKRRNKIVNRVK
jgi:hypothetical protein